MSAHTLRLHISYQTSLAYPCMHETRRDTSKSFFESVEQLDFLSRFFFWGGETETRLGRIWTAITMRLWSIISQSQREVSFTWWALALVKQYGTILLVWKLKLIFLKWLWHVFYMQITGMYSFHELLHKMAVFREHILHVPKGISHQPSVLRSWLYDRHPLSIICPQALICSLWGHLKYNHMFTYSSIWNVCICKSWIIKHPLTDTASSLCCRLSKTEN